MKGVISSGSDATSAAGAYALQHGGNAIDAMVASQLAAHVCEPMLTGFGGAGLATIRHEGIVYLVDMFTAMPGLGRDAIDYQMEKVVLDFGSTSQAFTVGEGAIAVPTIPQGLSSIHSQFGTLPMNVLANPAKELCRVGFKVSKACSYLLNLLYPIISRSPELSRWYLSRDGKPLKEGEVCKPKEMLADIEHFLSYGEKFFSAGLVKESLKTLHNSLLTKKDFQKYLIHTQISTPIKVNGLHLHLHDLPSAGREIFGAVKPLGISDPNELISKLSDAYLRFNRNSNIHAHHLKNLGNTTHISVADEAGNAASITTSLGETAGIVLPNTGIAMNNFLGEADVAHPILTQQAGNRLLTMCSPVILESQSLLLSLGSGGSSRIPGAILQVINNIIMGTSISEAVRASRFHTNCKDELIEILHEPISKSTSNTIQIKYPNIPIRSFPEPSLYFGGVHVAGVQDGQIVGAADGRRSGSTVIVR